MTGESFARSVGGGDPIPRAAAGGGEAEAGAEFLFVGQFVEGFEVEWLETIDLPRFDPPTLLAGSFQLEACCLNRGSVFIQLQESFREQFAQFAFDGFRLGIQQSAKVSLVCGSELLRSGAGTETGDDAANARGNDKQGGSEDQRAEEIEEQLVHDLNDTA